MSDVLYIGEISKEKSLGSYYLGSKTGIADVQAGLFGSFDSEGVPLVDYDRLFRGQPSVDPSFHYGIHYTPVTTAQYGLGLFDSFLATKNTVQRQQFLVQAKWLLNNAKIAPAGFKVWVHSFKFPMYRLELPWVSAMAQGQGISVLLRAYQMTQELKYLDVATSACEAFKYDMHVGGVSFYDKQGNLWLEEMPTNPPSHILNGFIFALWGVHDYWRVTGNKSAYNIWIQGVSTLKANLQRYEWSKWSCYDLLYHAPAGRLYHDIHILQLKSMFQLTDEVIFEEFFRRWQSYADGHNRCRRFVMHKARGVLRRLGIVKPKKYNGIGIEVS